MMECRHYNLGVVCLDCQRILAHIEGLMENMRMDFNKNIRTTIFSAIKDNELNSALACEKLRSGGNSCKIFEHEDLCFVCKQFKIRINELLLLYSRVFKKTIDESKNDYYSEAIKLI
jgi:hypothetical protein